MTHHHGRAILYYFVLLEVRPFLGGHSIESNGISIRNALGPEPPAPPMTGQIVVAEHLVVSLGTARLQAVSTIWPEIRRARARRSSVQPGVRVYHVDELRIIGRQVRARIEERKCGIQSGNSIKEDWR